MEMKDVFPVSVEFEDGRVEQFESVEDLMCNLEDFDPDPDGYIQVRDKLGQLVRLKLWLIG